MEEKLLKRSEIKEDLKWNIKAIYETEKDYENDLEKLKNTAEKFKKDFEGKLNDSCKILNAVEIYETIQILIDHTMHYASLDVSVDMTDSEKNLRDSRFNIFLSDILSEISFFTSELADLDTQILLDCMNNSEKYQNFFKDLIKNKPHYLDKKVEQALSNLNIVLEAPDRIYENSKQMDINFDDFEVDGKKYPMSFVKFENEYQYEKDTKVRRKAYSHFTNTLDKYKHTIAAIYNTQLQKEKALSKMRGFDNIFDYLLFDQDVTREMYDRQIDNIMQKLSAPMQKYMGLVKKQNNLDKMTFADLKLPLFTDFAPEISIEDSYDYVKNSLSVLGDCYLDYALKYKEQRWVDYAQNIGKSTGGFCASPYKKQPFILLSWTGLLSEVFTLVHEIGHGVHFLLSQEKNTIFDNEPSLYLVEAPSTCNEMLLTNYLVSQNKDEKFQKWALSTMIENTYYHNFVTHLLEADYQRKVYKLIDEGQSVNAYILSDLMQETYENFFGNEIDLTGANLTWMRQPHYYNGLYSYTYSAGLTVATVVSQNILKGNKIYAQNWVEFLKAGGTKNPVELCKIAGIDITTDKPLNDTIKFISDTIDKIAE